MKLPKELRDKRDIGGTAKSRKCSVDGCSENAIRSLSENREILWVQPEGLLLFMGNMPAIPQLILAFALADIFSYNALDTHIMPLWLFSVIVLVIGAVVIGRFAIPVFLRALRGMNDTGGNKEE